MPTFFVRDNATMLLLDIVHAPDKATATEQATVMHGPEIVVYSMLQDELRSAEVWPGGGDD